VCGRGLRLHLPAVLLEHQVNTLCDSVVRCRGRMLGEGPQTAPACSAAGTLIGGLCCTLCWWSGVAPGAGGVSGRRLQLGRLEREQPLFVAGRCKQPQPHCHNAAD
jgi:hypothetical protein